jgi:DNA-3-methyladenine glycosylase II
VGPGERGRSAGAARVHVPVREPFRLDLTVTVLQRLPTNPVEVWLPPEGALPGRYLRAFETPRGPVAWIVREAGARGLAVELRGPAGDAEPWRRRVARALGAGVDLAPFYARARRFPPISRIAREMRGVKPPRFAALHESFASVLLFQQVSLASAVATLRRLVVALTAPVEVEGAVLHPFPSAAAIAELGEVRLRALGMSGVKARALRSACEAVASGRLDEDALARLPSPELHERLLALDGVGPWTAALLMLRGFGRIDQFPPGDVAAEKLLRELGSEGHPRDGNRRAVLDSGLGGELLEAMGDARGMLYYHLFLHRMSRARRGPFAQATAPRARRRVE